MNTTAPRLVLLLKSGPGSGTSIAHKGGYAKYGNPPRWHKITADAPAPKGAPVAAHPKSAGHHEPAAHFTDEQWAALKLPDSNVNAPVFNKALEKLKAWSDAGDVTAIVGAQYGVNTYGKALAKIANTLLGMHGSAHKVTPGQKPGTHAASQVAEPADPHPTGLPEHLAPKVEPAAAEKPEDAQALKDKLEVLHDFLSAKPDSPNAPAWKAKIAEIEAKVGPLKKDAPTPAAPTPAESGPLAMPDFEEGATTTGVKAHYEHVAQKVIDHGHAGNGSVLEDMKATGLKPNHKGKVSNTWAGKTANSKKLLALHDAAVAHATGGGPDADTGPKEGDTKPGADGSTLVLKDGHWVKRGGDAPAVAPAAKGDVFKLDSQYEKMNAGEWVVYNLSPDGQQVYMHKVGAKVPNQTNSATIPAATLAEAVANGTAKKQAAADAGNPATVPSGTGSLSAQQLQNLQSIPWFKLKLPAENTNAKSHNAALAKIEAMAFSGDTAGLKAFINSKAGAKQTYAKKQALTAQTALAALGVEGATAAVPVEPAPVAQPPKASPDPYPLVNEWKAAIVAGKVPTKAQAEAFDALGDHDPDAQKEYFLDSVTALIDATPGVSQFGPDFDAAYAAANNKVHELHGHALAGTKPTRAKPAAPEVPAAPVPVKSAVFHNTTAGHNKFWSASLQGSTLKTVYGKIGSKGQSTVKEFGSPAAAVSAYQDLIDEKKAKGYQYQGPGVHLHDAPAAAVEQGPKEGDTKQGADGMLVLKNGHWVKVGEDLGGWSYDPSDMAMSGAQTLTFEKNGDTNYIAKTDDGYQVGVIDADGNPLEHEDHVFMADVVNFLKKKGFAPPVVALQKLDPSYKPAPAKIKKATLIDISTAIQTITPGQTKFSTNGAGKLATAAAKKGDGNGMAAAHTKAIALGFLKTASHIKAVADVMGVDTSGWAHVAFPAANAATAPPPAAPASPVSAGGMLSMDGWAQTGGQGGSNPGGKFKDPTGQEWYCKFPKDADTAKSEILAAKLYALAGLSSQDAVLVTKDGKVGIASKWVNIKKAASPGALAKVDGAQAGFAVDAWLGNWDVVGLSYDNLQVGPDGKAHRVDAGGSLEYRAQGEKKAFGSKVEELDTLLDAGKNAQTASVFKGMTKADLTASAAKVLAISDVAIRAMVNQYGPGDAAAKAKLADTLIARKKDIAAKFPEAAKKKKAPVFKPEEISAPPSFLNWGGKGSSGPSSKEFLNKANEDAVQAIFAAAKTGNADAVKKLTAPVFDKDTGAVTGHKPVLEHPSQHVKGYAQQAINEITYQLNPPKQFRFDGGHPLHSLNAAYPAHKGSPSSAVAQKLGKFIVLGEPGTVSLADVGLPEKIVHGEGGGTLSAQTYAKQAQAAIAKMPATQKQAVKSYTGSSYHAMNGSLWDGNPSGAAKAAGEALKTLGHDIAPGTVLSRKISLHGADLQQLLGASGKILQEPAIMSTSIRPSSWSGNVHLKLHVGPGVKGLWVGHHSLPGGGALSSNSGEDEMILPPGTRLMIVGVKTGSDKDGFGKSSGHVVEAIILPTE